MSREQPTSFDLYFYPREPSEAGIQALLDRVRGKPEEKIYVITEIAKKLKESLESTGIKKWEIVVKGYIEASIGSPPLPSGKLGFEATLTLSNQP